MKFLKGDWVLLRDTKDIGVVIETSYVPEKVVVSILGKSIREMREEEVELLSCSTKQRQSIEHSIKKYVEEQNG